jgi:CheY-specific phosphatase CheX
MDPQRMSGRPDLELVSPFITAALETFRVQYSMELTHRDPFKHGEKPGVVRDLVSVFSVLSGGASVSVAFCFPAATYQDLLSSMGVVAPAQGDGPNEDGIRELINIIFNQVKRLTNIDGRVIQRSIPAIFYGQALKVWYLTPAEPVIIPFVSGVGEFEIELAMER